MAENEAAAGGGVQGGGDGGGGGAASAVKEQPRTAPPRVDRLPPFRVLLHNDDVNEITSVANSLVELTPLKREAAVRVTHEAHRSGVALVLVTHKERAEFYQERLRSRRLTVTVEPAE